MVFFIGIFTGSSLGAEQPWQVAIKTNVDVFYLNVTWPAFEFKTHERQLRVWRILHRWFSVVSVLRWDTISLPCWWMTVPFPKMPSSVFGKVLLRIRRCQTMWKNLVEGLGWNFEPIDHITWTAQMVGSWVAVKVRHHDVQEIKGDDAPWVSPFFGYP